MTLLGVIVLNHIDWKTLGLGVVYTQLNDDDQDFMVPYVN
jgi:hypothetical protein